MAGMLFVVSVPNTATERRLREELHLAAKDRLDGKEPVTLEKGLEDMLQKLRVEHSLWNPVKGGTFFQVIFPTASGDQCENCLHCLSQLGVGKKFSSTVSVAPCNVYLKGVAGDPEVRTEDEDESEAAKRWANFVESIRSKLTVKQVVDGVRSGSECSFDYIALVLTADMIAAVGLVENNSINITAAMLVSPLMSPLMGVTFGVLIANWKLVRIGARTEAVGMLISLLFGFVFGLLVGAACNDMPWGGGVGDFPTSEMKGRGNFRSLWIGILWALPSGTGVALALLQGSAGPLIGVAISASLLPPIVNCFVKAKRWCGCAGHHVGAGVHLLRARGDEVPLHQRRGLQRRQLHVREVRGHLLRRLDAQGAGLHGHRQLLPHAHQLHLHLHHRRHRAQDQGGGGAVRVAAGAAALLGARHPARAPAQPLHAAPAQQPAQPPRPRPGPQPRPRVRPPLARRRRAAVGHPLHPRGGAGRDAAGGGARGHGRPHLPLRAALQLPLLLRRRGAGAVADGRRGRRGGGGGGGGGRRGGGRPARAGAAAALAAGPGAGGRGGAQGGRGAPPALPLAAPGVAARARRRRPPLRRAAAHPGERQARVADGARPGGVAPHAARAAPQPAPQPPAAAAPAARARQRRQRRPAHARRALHAAQLGDRQPDARRGGRPAALSILQS